ncbi:MAG: Arabinose 5-phosphate isomerase KdsD [Anaerolineae bacterium]|nr:Arabinose 5-phosphate isomerase KdsD [Anaerolineae bacterium]
MDNIKILQQAQAMIRAEGEVLVQIADQLADSFAQTVKLVSECNSRILVTGAGTSGTIARRLAHLLATCGMPAFFVHPADALHGPAAVVSAGDVLIALSKAGKSAEINHFAQVARQRGGKVISWTWEPESELAQLSDIVVVIRPDEKGEGDGVLPFGSSLANGAVGDALCLLAMRLRGFDLAELTQTHPAGATAELVKRVK